MSPPGLRPPGRSQRPNEWRRLATVIERHPDGTLGVCATGVASIVHCPGGPPPKLSPSEVVIHGKHVMEVVADDRRQLAEVISRNRDLYDVVSRHGLTDHDLLAALRSLRQEGKPLGDLWALVSLAARRKADSLAAVGG